MSKTLHYAECRLCGVRYVRGNEKVVLEPGDDFEVVPLLIPRCSKCKEQQDRTAGGRNKRLRR